ncbi:trypsin-like peptidase domain-containing protein [Streptomyces sp. NPDC056987]|uniref:nSTAND1 domain-containing NTPase n=1 Tax=Streptomyces sp. NPDC056987 TaxID=3345988 RepID=UPI00362F072C
MYAAEPPLAAAVLRVRAPDDGTVVGAGFLVTGELALTCAHVVASALGLRPGERPAEGAVVEVDLPLNGGPGTGSGAAPPALATVEPAHWPADGGASGAEDIAVLRLRAPLPGSVPLRMTEADDVWGHPVRALGFPAGYPDGVWHAGVLRARQGTGWLQFERAVDGNHEISGGFSGAPVWDERLASVVGMVVAADGTRPSAFLIPTRALLGAVPSLRAAVLPPSPFRGLSAFQETDGDVFFGRDEESDEVAALVTEHPVVTVFGPSGCGKSSVVRAGAVPRLRRAGYAVVVVRPSGPSGLLGGLARELARLTRPELTGGALRSESRAVAAEIAEHGLAGILAELTERRQGEREREKEGEGVRGLVVVIDQLEELLADEPEPDRDSGPDSETETETDSGPVSVARAVAVLFPARPPAALRVVSTLRADFLEAVTARPGLGRAVRGKSLLLLPMSGEQVREAVVRPVEAVPAVRYADGLAQRILDDCGDGQGVLPLLEFTLDQLWERQHGGLLTHRAYEELGGVSGALAERAEAVWRREVRGASGAADTGRDEPNELAGGATGEEDIARRLFTRLVRLPLGGLGATRRVVPRAELGEAEWSLARALAGERLVVIGLDGERRETVELAHEALISAWGRLGAWVERDRDFLAWREALRHDRERWEAAGHAPDLLPAASALDAARRWERERDAELSEADAGFLRRGRDHERRRVRRRRGLFSVIGTVLALAAVLGTLFVYQTGVTEQRTAEAGSRSLAAASTDLRTTDPALSALVAVAAYRRSPTESARDALLQSYLAYGRTRSLLSGALGRIERIAASDDGRVVLAVSVLGRATLFVRDDGEEEEGQGAAEQVRRVHLPAGTKAHYPVVARDGTGAGYVGTDGTLVWHDVRAEGSPDPEPGPDALIGRAWTAPGGPPVTREGTSVRSAAVSPDGSRIAAGIDGDIVVWDLTDRSARVRTISPPAGMARFDAVWFGQDRDTVLATGRPPADLTTGPDADRANSTSVLAYEGSRPPRTVVTGVAQAQVSGDGTALAYCRVLPAKEKGVYHVIQVADGKERGRYTGRQCKEHLALDRTGRRIAVAQNLSGSVVEIADTRDDTFLYAAGTESETGTAGSVSAGLGSPRVIHGRLVDDEGRLGLLSHDGAGVTLNAVPSEESDEQETLPQGPFFYAALTPDGSTAISAAGALRLLRTDRVGQRFEEIAAAERPSPEWGRETLRTNGDGSLVAEPVRGREIQIREVPSLRLVSSVPVEATASSDFRFDGDRHLLVTTGTVVERRDARTGRRTHTVDLRDLGIAGDGTGSFAQPVTWSYPEAGHVAVLDGTSVRVVDIRAGREVKGLRIGIGGGATGVRFDKGGRFMAVFRTGGVWELWRLDPLRRELGPMRGIGEWEGRYAAEFIDEDGGFLVADTGRVRIYRAGQRSYERSYDFGAAYRRAGAFPAVSADGSTVMATDGRQVIAVRLDPEAWIRTLCTVTGQRALTDEDRAAVAADVPAGPVCGT